MNRGLVIGKFYPPHLGHQYLITQAQKKVDQLTVVVCEKTEQKISGAIRASWLKEMVPGIKTLVVPDTLPADDSWAWAQFTKEFLGYTPDAVFTSELYGQVYAKFLGTKHVLVDLKRQQVPISATVVKKNPLAQWEFLPPPVRAYFTKRVCILGAESTGTTTLAKALAQHYQTVWVPEFGRTYWEAKQFTVGASRWQTEEFIYIAQQQNQWEDDLAKLSNKILICDTDSFATNLWHERYVGHLSKEVAQLNANRPYDLYLLTDVNIPFVQDGTRDGEHIRNRMHQRFSQELNKAKKPWVLVSGSHQQRMKQAIELCDQIIQKNRPLI